VRRRKQQGLIFLIVLLTLLAIGGAFFVIALTPVSRANRELQLSVDSSKLLAEAKVALLGYAAGTFGGGSRPGQLPRPDTLEGAPASGSYDGNQNAGCLDGTKANGLPPLVNSATKSPNVRCVGRLPWKLLGLRMESTDETDSLGLIPWYAVSANLADPNFCLSRLNPGTLALPVASTFTCPSDAPPFPWLTVCDETGRILSNRVAIVLIAPGVPVSTFGRTQQRSTSVKPQPSDFLDAVPPPGGLATLPVAERCSSFDNAGLTNEFVSALPSATFNDRVIYVTVDELSAELEKRVALEARKAVMTHVEVHKSFPWPASIADPTLDSSYTPKAPFSSGGFLPFHTAYPAHEFETEIFWKLPATPPPRKLAVPASFTCVAAGASRTCRLALSGAPIPDTIQASDLVPYLDYSISQPKAKCKWQDGATLGDKAVECRVDISKTPLTYELQYRSGGAWVTSGTVSGSLERTLNLSFVGVPTYSAATATNGVTRQVSTDLNGYEYLTISDKFLESSGVLRTPILLGNAGSAGDGKSQANGIRVYPIFPDWYFTEKWYQYIYFAFSPDVKPGSGSLKCSTALGNCLTSGAKTEIDAVILSVGPPLPGQLRATSAPPLSAFLEGVNESSATTRIFAPSSETRTSLYADYVATIP
jgi:hypothetical protein